MLAKYKKLWLKALNRDADDHKGHPGRGWVVAGMELTWWILKLQFHLGGLALSAGIHCAGMSETVPISALTSPREGNLPGHAERGRAVAHLS
ncbi:hypothetical protein Cadr_000010424 [Camelus dromedarius]|uniref:Uncharacterized protein n=1 Tax=Camelus dromedarius TaxID=9838 RepID=A0A5N4DXH5_CAMDR|nr:hypothetical protein Cadr_000010424 [Camelus dromedarius]